MTDRNMDGISTAQEEPAEEQPQEPVVEKTPGFKIRNLKTGFVMRYIPVQRGLSWQDVNAIASGFLTNPNVVPRGAWLDMEGAYWEQSETR